MLEEFILEELEKPKTRQELADDLVHCSSIPTINTCLEKMVASGQLQTEKVGRKTFFSKND